MPTARGCGGWRNAAAIALPKTLAGQARRKTHAPNVQSGSGCLSIRTCLYGKHLRCTAARKLIHISRYVLYAPPFHRPDSARREPRINADDADEYCLYPRLSRLLNVVSPFCQRTVASVAATLYPIRWPITTGKARGFLKLVPGQIATLVPICPKRRGCRLLFLGRNKNKDSRSRSGSPREYSPQRTRRMQEAESKRVRQAVTDRRQRSVSA